MSLSALSLGQIILSWNVDKERYRNDADYKNSFTCQHCQSEMRFTSAQPKVIAYFSHKPDTKCPYEENVNAGSETAFHIQAKYQAWEQLTKRYPTGKVYIEYRMPNCGKNGRVADVAVVFPSQAFCLYEIQLSSITLESLQERTEDYLNEGANEILWVLGKKNYKRQDLTDYLLNRLGCYATVDEDSEKSIGNLYEQ